jgi:hypothetical protein
LRLVWSSEALAGLENVAERAPRGAAHLVEAVEWLVDSPFPSMHRLLTGRQQGQHVLSVPPYVVFYAIEGDQLTVLHGDGRPPTPPALVTARPVQN